MSDVSRLPGPRVDKWEWQLLGACRGEASELFFHPENTRRSQRAAREATAKAICARCPVLERCLAHSLTVREPYGVWGGLSESEREALFAARVDIRSLPAGAASCPRSAGCSRPPAETLAGVV